MRTDGTEGIKGLDQLKSTLIIEAWDLLMQEQLRITSLILTRMGSKQLMVNSMIQKLDQMYRAGKKNSISRILELTEIKKEMGLKTQSSFSGQADYIQDKTLTKERISWATGLMCYSIIEY